MTANLILDLTVEWISLYRRGPHAWQRLGGFRSDDPSMSGDLSALVHEVTGDRRTIVIVPREEVAFAGFSEGETPSSANELMAILEGKTPFPAETLRLDWRRAGPGIQIAAIPVTVMAEAETFARAHGLDCTGIAARPDPDHFAGSPWFGLSGEAAPNGLAALAGGRDVVDVSPKSVPQHSRITEATERRISEARDRALTLAQMAPAAPGVPFYDLDETEAPVTLPQPQSWLRRRARLLVATGMLAALVLGGIGWFDLQRPATDPVAPAPSEVALSAPSMSVPEGGSGALPDVEVSSGSVPVVPSLGGRAPVAGADAEPASADTAGQPVLPDPAAEISDLAALPDEAAGNASFYTPSPGILNVPAFLGLDVFNQPALDPSFRTDALALPDPGVPPGIVALAGLSPPPPPEKSYPVDAQGLIVPKPGGQETPEGYWVVTGAPPVLPLLRPELAPEVESEASVVVVTNRSRLAADDPLRHLSPAPRPAGLAETFERNSLGGRTSGELSALRPTPRPPHAVAVLPVVVPEAPLALPDGSLARLPRPASRPNTGLKAVVPVPVAPPAPAPKVAALPPAKADPKVVAAPPAKAAPKTAAAPPAKALLKEPDEAPAAPPRQKTAKATTKDDRIDLSEINLLGTFGSNADMRALVRLANGNVLKVRVGDKVDGGRVSSIDRDELTYEKRGKQRVLRMPGG